MNWKDFFRKLFRIGIVTGTQSAASAAADKPITAGNVLKPALKDAGKAVAVGAVEEAVDKIAPEGAE